jgi:hypothetical protein
MTTNDESTRGALVTSADRIGNVLIVVGQDVRRCVVCEQLFTRRASAEHATLACYPARSGAVIH